MRLFKDIHDKTLKFFAVVTAADPLKLLTIVLTKAEALEYAVNRLRIEHYDHFKAWCALRDYDSEDQESWVEYLTNLIKNGALEDTYLIMPVEYYYDDIASIIRMFGCCEPIGCSFDTAAEKVYWNATIDPEHAEKALNIIREEIIRNTEENPNEYKSR